MVEEKIFSGFPVEPKENYWQYPKSLDGYWHQLSGSEQKVLDYLLRHTWGYKKTSDRISISQFKNGIQKRNGEFVDKGTGLSDNTTILKALKRLEELGFITTTQEQGETKLIQLKFDSTPLGNSTPTSLESKEVPPVRTKEVTSLESKDTINNRTINSTTYAPKRALSIVFLFASFKRVDLTDVKQRSSFISRYIRSAKLLEGYDNLRIKQAMSFLEKTGMKWTLETVLKFIDDDLQKLEQQYFVQPDMIYRKAEVVEAEVKRPSPEFLDNWKKECADIINGVKKIEKKIEEKKVEPKQTLVMEEGFWDKTKVNLDF